MLDTKILLTKILEKINVNHVEIEVKAATVISTGNISANSYKASADYNVLVAPTGNGWEAIGVVGHKCTSAYINASNCRITDDRTKLSAGFNNMGNSAHSADFTAYILWKRTV